MKKVTGKSGEDLAEQQRRQLEKGESSDGALKLSPVRMPMEWRVIQVGVGLWGRGQDCRWCGSCF